MRSTSLIFLRVKLQVFKILISLPKNSENLIFEKIGAEILFSEKFLSPFFFSIFFFKNFLIHLDYHQANFLDWPFSPYSFKNMKLDTFDFITEESLLTSRNQEFQNLKFESPQKIFCELIKFGKTLEISQIHNSLFLRGKRLPLKCFILEAREFFFPLGEICNFWGKNNEGLFHPWNSFRYSWLGIWVRAKSGQVYSETRICRLKNVDKSS